MLKVDNIHRLASNHCQRMRAHLIAKKPFRSLWLCVGRGGGIRYALFEHDFGALLEEQPSAFRTFIRRSHKDNNLRSTEHSTYLRYQCTGALLWSLLISNQHTLRRFSPERSRKVRLFSSTRRFSVGAGPSNTITGLMLWYSSTHSRLKRPVKKGEPFGSDKFLFLS